MLCLPLMMSSGSYISLLANGTRDCRGGSLVGGFSCRNLFLGTMRGSNHQKKTVELARFVPLPTAGFGEEEDGLKTSANQMMGRFEASLNAMSKWLVGGVFAIAIIWKHDGVTIWAAMGAFLNSFVSTTLKKILNQERPSALRSDPGMPSSHAQSIFYTVVFAIQSVMDGMGMNVSSAVVGAIIFICGAYLSWLRVSQQFHTRSQVFVGAALGSTCSLTWLQIWRLFVLPAFDSSIRVRAILLLGAVAYYVVLLFSVIRHWLQD